MSPHDSFDWLKLIGEVGIAMALGILYWARVRRLDRAERPSGLRQISFGAGLVVAASASAGLAEVSMRQVSGHMVQHLLLMDLAAFLVIAGLTRSVLEPLARVRLLRRARGAFRPLAAMLIFIGVIVVWHIPALYNATAESELAHAASRTSFLAAGLIKWMALIGPIATPIWFATGLPVLFVAAEHLFVAAMGNVFMWAGTPIYSVYAERTAAVGVDPLTDQSIGGGIMAVWGMLLTLVLLAWVFLRWSKAETERQDLLDFAERHGLVLDAADLSRAVVAGRGAALMREMRARVPDEKT